MKKVLLLASLAVASLTMSAAGNGVTAEQYSDTTVVVTTYSAYNPGDPAEVQPIEGRIIKNKYFKAMWVNETQEWTDSPWSEDPKSDLGVAINWGGMQCFTGKPIVNMVDIGLDIHFAASYVSYKGDAFKIKGQTEVGADDMHHGSLGIGIGPAVAVAPFGAFDNILRYLTAKVYYHFTPSYSCMIGKDDDDKTSIKGAFCLYQSFGGEISYRRLGIGVETLWGKAKYKELDLSDYIDIPNLPDYKTKEKSEIKTPSFRIYVAYKF